MIRNIKISKKRYIKQYIFNIFCITSCLMGSFGLFSILFSLIQNGIPAINKNIFIKNTPPPGMEGGLSNAIIGSICMTVFAMLIAMPLGIFIATYLVDYSRSRFSKILRFINDMLLSSPSIVIGLFVYISVVRTTGHFSGFAGSIALSIIALPMIVRSTEDVLYLVSPMLKESALSMGIKNWIVTIRIVYKVVIQGIITACLLALSRIAGETAPLLFTALNNQFDNQNFFKPMASLPVVIFQYAMSPYQNWRSLAWSGALIITMAVLFLNVLARMFAKDSN